MYLKLFAVPELNSDMRYALLFPGSVERKTFFNDIAGADFEIKYIKNLWDLNIEVVVHVYDPWVYGKYNYARITRGLGASIPNPQNIQPDFFYFITDQEQVGNNQMKFKLRLDTVTTFFNPGQYQIDLSNKTLVLREHRARFNFTEFKPIIDKTIESQLPQRFKTEIDTVPEPGAVTFEPIEYNHTGLQGDFYVGDRLFSIPHDQYLAPIFTSGQNRWYLCSAANGSKGTWWVINEPEIKVVGSQVVIIKYYGSDLAINDIPYANFDYIKSLGNIGQPQGRIRFAFGNLDTLGDFKPVAFVFTEFPQTFRVQESVQTITPLTTYQYHIRGDYNLKYGGVDHLIVDDWSLYNHRVHYNSVTGEWNVTKMSNNNGIGNKAFDYGVVHTVPNGATPEIIVGVSEDSFTPVYQVNHPIPFKWYYIEQNGTLLNDADITTVTTKLFTDMDLSDARFSKIVEYPYIPPNLNYYYDGTNVYIDWTSVLELNLTYELDLPTFDYTKVDKNRTNKDPKLWHSQIRQYILSMHRQTMLVRPEDMDTDILDISIKYDLSVPNSVLMSYNKAENVTPYDNMQVIQLNNQVAQVLSEGYTYAQYYKDNEMTQREIQANARDRNAAISGIQQVTGVVGGMIAGGGLNPVTIGFRAAQAGLSIAQLIANNYDEKRLHLLEYENKMQHMLLGNINIVGSGLRFMKENDDDKLKMIKITPTDDELNYFDDVFYYYGYQTNEFKTPNFKTRKYFNFLQCIPHFDMYASTDVTDDIRQDIIERLSKGVTFFHYQAAGASNGWLERFNRLQQTKENWEV
jgi:hypothetical protein